MTTATARQPASVRLSARLNSALVEQAKQLKISKDVLVRRAIANMLEDINDLRDAKAVLAKGAKPVSLSKLKAELGLGD